MNEIEVALAAIEAARLPTALLAIGALIGLICHGVAEVILARQGKSPSPLPAPSWMKLIQMGLLAAAVAAGIPLLS